MLKKLAIATAVAVVAASSFMADAEAKPGHGGHYGGNHFRGYRYYGPVVPVYPLVTTCEYSRRMWRRTGRTYWKIRYYDCMGW